MSAHVFVEDGDYFAHCSVYEKNPGVWVASVMFERKADHVNDLVPGMRHKLKQHFSSREEAMQAAISHAHAKIADGTTNI